MAGDISDTKYLTNVAELTAIANAIRAKGGTTEQLVYPDGFISAINSIQAGSGGVDIKIDELTPDFYFCNKDDCTAYLDLSNAITGTYFSFVISMVGTVFDPNSGNEEDECRSLIAGIYNGDYNNDGILMKSGSSDAMNAIATEYDSITKRINVREFFDTAKMAFMPSAVDYINYSYVINWN